MSASTPQESIILVEMIRPKRKAIQRIDRSKSPKCRRTLSYEEIIIIDSDEGKLFKLKIFIYKF